MNEIESIKIILQTGRTHTQVIQYYFYRFLIILIFIHTALVEQVHQLCCEERGVEGELRRTEFQPPTLKSSP